MNITMKQVEGGVCAAAGFSANGLNCGLNPDRNKNDLALIWSEKERTAAAVYTTNKVNIWQQPEIRRGLLLSTVRMPIPVMQTEKKRHR